MQRNTRRIVLRIGVGVGTLVLLLGWLGLAKVEYQPYFQTEYYATTTHRLQEQAARLTVATNELSAGFGRALLTPTLHAAPEDPVKGRFKWLPLAGYGNRKGRPATGVHDDLYVKAVAVRVADKLGVLVGADALIIPAEVTDLAMAELSRDPGLRREQVYLSATHTHASVGGWGEGMVAEAFAGGFQPGVRTWMADRIVSAVREAVKDLNPASMGQGGVAAPEYVRNRLVGRLGQTDPDFEYLVFKQANGRIGVIGSYAAHATVLPASNMEFSADYPGAWQRAIEQATGGIAVFMGGGVGSHGPIAGAPGFEGTERMGKALAGALLERLPAVAFTNRIAFGLLGLEVMLPPLNARVTDGIRLRPWVARRILPVREGTFLQAMRFQDSVWVSTPCDFSGELALGVKQSLRPRGVNAVITSFNGDYIGYVISSRYYHMAGYEPRIMSFFGPNVPDYFTELARSLALALTTHPVSGAKSDSRKPTETSPRPL